MKYSLYIENRPSRGVFAVYINFIETQKMRFRVKTPITVQEKYPDNVIPKTEPNWKSKTACLGIMFKEIEKYLISNVDTPYEMKKAALTSIVKYGSTEHAEDGLPPVKTLADYVDEYREVLNRDSTKTMYRITANKIREFDASATFDTITKDWLMKFENYFIKKHAMSVNGIAIHIRNIRTVFNWAIDNEWTDKYPFRRFKVKSEKVPIRNMSAEQIAQLRDYPVEPWQEIYRDFFMLSFYLCGMNAGDMLLLRKLTNGRLVYKRQKTGHIYDLPVPPEAKRIIEKYKGKDFLLSPMDTYKDYHDFTHHWNDALKKIGPSEKVADKLGKKRKVVYHPLFSEITTYVARYSFASIAAEIDVPRDIIALCLGHAWADVTSHYVAYNKKKIDKAVRDVIDYVNKF